MPDSPPKKYVKIDGVMKLNPEYKAYMARQGKEATSVKNPEKAIPVVSNMEDHMELNESLEASGNAPVPLAESTDATIEMMQEPDICYQVGVESDEMVDGLGSIFNKYEVPIGLMNKLMGLTEYELEFIIDDSGSMNFMSDLKDSSGNSLMRWQEVQMRLRAMFEVLSFIPTEKITMHFFNRGDRIIFERSNKKPDEFQQEAFQKISQVFRKSPSGSTPVKKTLEKSFAENRGKRVARYLFCDGIPDGGEGEIVSIKKMLKDRIDPEGNPFTFLSCSEIDSDVEWMKEAEEVVPFCAEYDDFNTEAAEVSRDQGDALPFTRGFHLIGQLVGSMNPEDLDAMDESVPFTKYMLDNILGIKTTVKDYRHYFDEFKAAQARRIVQTKMDKIKKNQNWELDYNSFLTENVAKNIQSVQKFKQELAKNA